MKVHIIKSKTIFDFCKGYNNAIKVFYDWLQIINKVDWKTPKDILSTFGSADLLGNGSERVVFNIGGNKYRMICSYYFGNNRTHLYINWIGTHADYDAICKQSLQFTVQKY